MPQDASIFLCSGRILLPGLNESLADTLLYVRIFSHALIAAACLSVPIVLIYLLFRRADLPFRRLLCLAGLFMLGAGTSRLFGVLALWWPVGTLGDWALTVTAMVAVAVVIAMVRSVPLILELPSPETLQRINEDLERRVGTRTKDLLVANQKLEQEARQREEAEAEVRRLNESLELRLSELQALLDLLPVGIAIAYDVELRELRFNREFAHLTGVVPSQKASLSAPPIGISKPYKLFEGDRELPPDEMPMRRVLLDNRPLLDMELRIRRADGKEFQVVESAVPLRDEAGGARGAVVTLQDITAQKQAALERIEMERHLQESQKMESLGVLAGGIAHDFNNLLTGILGNASLARLDLPAGHATVRGSLDNLEQAALRASDLCKQMLAYAGKGRFTIQPIGLSGLVKETASLLEVTLGRRSVLKLELAPGLPAFQGDATQVRQILMNLVINASEAIGEKGGTITIRTGSLDATREELRQAGFVGDFSPGEHVFAEVADDGCGMDAQTLAKIFEPFYTTKFTGRGLGLSAVLGIVRGHKGAIRVVSQPGCGTTFTVLFPATDQPATPPSPVLHSSALVRSSGSVLVADDEDTVRAVAAKILTNAGYDVTVASDGADAVEVFRANPDRYKAVLLDLTMPRMDGEEALEELQKIRPDVRVLLMSGFNEQETVKRFIGRGVAGFLPKPFGTEMLLIRLREALKNRKGHV